MQYSFLMMPKKKDYKLVCIEIVIKMIVII